MLLRFCSLFICLAWATFSFTQDLSTAQNMIQEGEVFFEQGELDMAHNYFNSARLIYEREEAWKPYVALGIKRSKLQENAGDFDASLRELGAVFGAFEDGHLALAPVYLRTGKIHELKENLEPAIYAYNRALETYQAQLMQMLAGFEPMDAYINPSLGLYTLSAPKDSLLEVLIYKAASLKAIGRLEKNDKALYAALNCYKQADQILNELRSERSDSSLCVLLNDPNFDFYLAAEESASFVFEQTNREKHQLKALYYAEKSQAIKDFGSYLKTNDSIEIKNQKERLHLLDNPIKNKKKAKEEFPVSTSSSGSFAFYFLALIPFLLGGLYFRFR